MPGAALGAVGSAIAAKIGGATLQGIAAAFFTNLVLGGISELMKPKAPTLPEVDTGIATMIREPAANAKVIYGRARVSGPLSFVHATDGNDYLHLIVPLTCHEVEEIEDIYVEDVALTLDANNYATNSEYTTETGHQVIRAKSHTGSSTQAADSDLIADAPDKWTSAHQGKDIAYVYVTAGWDVNIWASGIPNISAVVKGKKLYDPRDATTSYSSNPALAIYDYLTNTTYGLAVPASEIDTDSFNTAADVCDESVNLDPTGTESRYTCNGVVDTGVSWKENLNSLLTCMAGDLVYQNGKWFLYAGEYRTPTVSLDESDLQGGISVQTRKSRRDLFNTVKGVYYNPDDDFQLVDFPEVTNATYVTEDNGDSIINHIQLPFTASPATAQRIAKALLEQNRRQITVQLPLKMSGFQLQVGDNFQLSIDRFGWSNKVFKVTDWSFSVDVSKSDDSAIGVVVQAEETDSSVWTWSQEETAVTASPSTNLPDPLTVAAPTNLTWSSSNADLVITADGKTAGSALITWTASTNQFVKDGGSVEVQTKLLSAPSSQTIPDGIIGQWEVAQFLDGSKSKYRLFGVDGGVYDVRVRFINYLGKKSSWTTLSTKTLAAKSSPPSDISSFTVNQNSDGIVTFSWSEIGDLDLYGYEIRYASSSATPWSSATPLTTAQNGTSTTTTQVPPGDWVFYIKAIDTLGNYSNKSTVAEETAINPNEILLQLDHQNFTTGTLTDLVRHYTGVLSPEDQYPASYYGWSTFDVFVPNPVASASYETTQLDLGADFDVRAWANIDSELGPSVATGLANPTFQLCYIPDGFDTAVTGQESNSISSAGTFTNMILDYRGNVIPQSQNLGSDDGWSTFDVFVPNPYATCEYEATELDVGSDRTLIFTMSLSEELGPGETSGSINGQTKIDYKQAAGSYDGFEAWTTGQIQARYIKHKVTFNTSAGVSVLRGLNYVIDCYQNWTIGNKTARYFSGKVLCDFTQGTYKITDVDFVLDKKERQTGAEGVSVDAGGESITFSTPFYNTPRINVTPQSASAHFVTITSPSSTGFTINVFNSSGTQVAGTVDWRAEGA